MKTAIDVIKDRKSSSSLPLQRTDGLNIALVVEGGGMRGVAAGGMVSGLEKLGLLNCFDSVHGSSAGAAAGAYFVAGQAQFGTRMFYEDLCGEEFINPKRAFHSRHIMDTTFLVDNVMTNVKPLDFGALSASKIPLKIVTTDIDSGAAVVEHTHTDYGRYRKFLKASITIPFIAGGPISIDGNRLMDGGLVQQIALQSAFDTGASHILVLQTRRREEQQRPEDSFKLKLQAALVHALYGGNLYKLVQDRNKSINATLAYVSKGVGPDGQNISSISLEDSIDYIHRLTKRPEPLKKAAEVMTNKVISVFS